MVQHDRERVQCFTCSKTLQLSKTTTMISKLVMPLARYCKKLVETL